MLPLKGLHLDVFIIKHMDKQNSGLSNWHLAVFFYIIGTDLIWVSKYTEDSQRQQFVNTVMIRACCNSLFKL